MLRAQVYGAHQRVLPVRFGLAGQAVYEVYVQVVKSGLAGRPHGLLHLQPVVPPADELQYVVVGALGAQGYAVEALPAQKLEVLQPGAVRVGLQRHLGVAPHAPAVLQLGPELRQAGGAVVAGRAAAEVDRVHLIALERAVALPYMRDQRVLVLGHEPVAAGQGVKVAVAALGGAERYVDVDAEAPVHSLPHFFVSFKTASRPVRRRAPGPAAPRRQSAAPGSAVSPPAWRRAPCPTSRPPPGP